MSQDTPATRELTEAEIAVLAEALKTAQVRTGVLPCDVHGINRCTICVESQ